ncbi:MULTISPECIES: hypothetical protein [Stenotrophomonas]|uniref:hypothetical protein n=1 Tax=Stenotrophomonas TaxID=40323 RepID=UPI00128F7A16|nr:MULTISPECIES: hypothetical protein [Stenotrophomonas]
MKIRSLTKREEKQVLTSMLAGLNEPIDNSWRSMLKRQAVALTIPLLIAAIALGVLRAQSMITLFATAGALIVGLVIGHGVLRITAAQHWPVVAHCLDRDKIEQRLRELDA